MDSWRGLNQSPGIAYTQWVGQLVEPHTRPCVSLLRLVTQRQVHMNPQDQSNEQCNESKRREITVIIVKSKPISSFLRFSKHCCLLLLFGYCISTTYVNTNDFYISATYNATIIQCASVQKSNITSHHHLVCYSAVTYGFTFNHNIRRCTMRFLHSLIKTDRVLFSRELARNIRTAYA